MEVKENNMSIKILTLKEAEETEKLCLKYGECFEVVFGKAKKDYICDNSGKSIPKGTECASCLILPTNKHFNYQHQKQMLGDYVE